MAGKLNPKIRPKLVYLTLHRVEGGRRGVATELVTIHSYKHAVELLRTFFHQPLAWTVCFGFSVCRALTRTRHESRDDSRQWPRNRRDDEPKTAHDLAQILSPGSIAAMATNPLGGRPPCPRCGETELRTLRGEALRATWAEEEGVKWSWRRCTNFSFAGRPVLEATARGRCMLNVLARRVSRHGDIASPHRLHAACV